MSPNTTRLGIGPFDRAFGGIYLQRPTVLCGRRRSGKFIVASQLIVKTLLAGERILLFTAKQPEEILAAVILKKGETMTAEELQDYVRKNMAKHKVPRYVDFVDAFPQNAAGKILKYKMREDAAKRLNIAKVDGIVAN